MNTYEYSKAKVKGNNWWHLIRKIILPFWGGRKTMQYFSSLRTPTPTTPNQMLNESVIFRLNKNAVFNKIVQLDIRPS